MRVALAVPNCSHLKFNDVCAPMNLGYLASYLRCKVPDVEVRIFDGVLGVDVFEETRKFNPDVFGVTATTPQSPTAYKLLRQVKSWNPKILTLIGGVHATALPHEASEYADVVVVGEGETALVSIIKNCREGMVNPTVLEGKYVENLNEIPMPAYDLIDMDAYVKKAPHLPGLFDPCLSLLTSRGCPYRCVFCRNSFRAEPVRYFSASRVVEEIKFFVDGYGVKSIMFNDDEMIINVDRLKEMKQLLDREGLTGRFVWGCQSRATSLNREVLELVKSMGCRVIALGIEHVVPEFLRILKCGSVTVEDNEAALKLGKEVGVYMAGGFVFGYPGETKKDLLYALKWIEKHTELSFVGINVLMPFPGTTVWKLCMKKGLLPEKIDYERMLPTMFPKNTYIINKTVDQKFFDKYMLMLARFIWIYDKTRADNSLKLFFGLARYKTWWWCLLRHPLKMFRAFRHCLGGLF